MKRTSTLPLMMPTTPLALVDVWKVGLTAFELWSTSLSTIAMRNHLWQTQPFFSSKMMQENQRMVTEKIEASMEAGLVMQKALFNLMKGQHVLVKPERTQFQAATASSISLGV